MDHQWFKISEEKENIFNLKNTNIQMAIKLILQ